ncbi:MAG TPA: hypothetical protein ENF93_02345 [Ignisphaera sp.]|nr:hypothetical protein [Ignisphaera sp.]
MVIAGFNKIDITPSPGMPMAGYINRVGKAIGAHDPLYARTMYLSDGSEELVLVVLDLIRIDRELYEELALSIERSTGIPREKIFITATHTHSGPEVSLDLWATKELSNVDRELVASYRKELSRAISSAVLQAVEDTEPVELMISSNRVEGVAVNRINPDKQIDSELLALIAKRLNGSIKGIVISFSCHPTVLGPDNLLYSGDLYGYIAREIEKTLSRVVLMPNGAAGNVSTRFSRKAQNYEEVIRLGNKVVESFIDSLHNLERLSIDTIRIIKKRISLRLRETPIEKLIELKERVIQELEKARASGASHGTIRFLESNLYGIKIAIERHKKMSSLKNIDIEVNAIHIGDLVFITFPGELFIEYQQNLKSLKKNRRVAIIGYANGYIGYVPHYSYGKELTYEDLVSIIDDMEYTRIEQTLSQLLTPTL